MKLARSDIGGDYYGSDDKTGRTPGPFAKYLEQHVVGVHYTMPETPQQNGSGLA